VASSSCGAIDTSTAGDPHGELHGKPTTPANTNSATSTTPFQSAPVLQSIAVTQANPSIAAGPRPQQFTATGTYSDNTTKDLTSAV